MADVGQGSLLISDPFLQDPNFMRTAILVCEHLPEGSFGFVLNRPYEKPVGDVVAELEGIDFPVFYGGPVQPNTLHFIHSVPDIIPDSVRVAEGIYWGGRLEDIMENIKLQKITPEQIRFYIGYSGWGEGQLDDEIASRSWIITPANHQLVFHSEPELIWRDALKTMGGEYQQMVNYPIDPQLN